VFADRSGRLRLWEYSEAKLVAKVLNPYSIKVKPWFSNLFFLFHFPTCMSSPQWLRGFRAGSLRPDSGSFDPRFNGDGQVTTEEVFEQLKAVWYNFSLFLTSSYN